MEFEVNGVKYKTQKMNAFDQLHVARKLAPVVGAIGNISALAAGDASVFGSLVKAISDLPEEDCNVVLHKCLAAVSRGDTTPAGTTWAPIWNAQAKRLMFDDIDLIVMLQITGRVIQDSLSSFTNALPSGSLLVVR